MLSVGDIALDSGGHVVYLTVGWGKLYWQWEGGGWNTIGWLGHSTVGGGGWGEV